MQALVYFVGPTQALMIHLDFKSGFSRDAAECSGESREKGGSEVIEDIDQAVVGEEFS